MKRWNLLVAALLLVAARATPHQPLRPPGERGWCCALASDAVDAKTLRIEPADSVESTRVRGRRPCWLCVRGARGRAPGRVASRACVVTVPIAELSPGAVVERTLVPWLDFGGPHVGVGFDTPVTIEVTPGCPGSRSRPDRVAAVGWRRWRAVAERSARLSV